MPWSVGGSEILSPEQIDALLARKPISDEWPWATCDEEVVDKHWEEVLDEICRSLNLRHKSEFGHYGSGYASYVDSWFYRDDDDFRFGEGRCYWGLVILYSRLSPYYAMGQGQKAWNDRGGSSYLPCFDFVDHFTHQSVVGLVSGAEAVLERRGLRRIRKEDVSENLDIDIVVPTILQNPPLHHFDAIFYWED